MNTVKMSPQLASTDLRVSEVAEMWSIVDRLVDTEDFLNNYIEYSDDPQELNTEHNRLFNFVQKIRARRVLETNEFQTLMTQIDSNIGTDGGAVPRLQNFLLTHSDSF